MKLAIGICNNGSSINSDFFWNFNAIIKPKEYQTVIFRGNSRNKAASLNEITEQALVWGADFILYLDYDMSFPQDTIIKLFKHNLPIVGGLYHLKSPPFSPVAGWTMDKDGKLVLVNQNKNVWKFDYITFPEGDVNGLVEVEWTGIGCLMVKREVFLTMDWLHNRFYDTWDKEKGIRSYGHDVNFCIDAKKLGYKTFIDRTINCGHLGIYDIDEEFIHAFYNSGMNLKWIEEIKKTKSSTNYWDRIWRLENLDSTNTRKYPEEFKFMIDYIPEGSKVADIGCGLGLLPYRLKTEKKCDCFGYDFSEVAIDKLKKKCGIDGEVRDILNWGDNGDKENSYDFVVSNHVLEHFSKDEVPKVMDVYKRLAKKGTGKIIIAIPVPRRSGLSDLCLEHKEQYNNESITALMNQYFKDPVLGNAGHSIIIIGENV